MGKAWAARGSSRLTIQGDHTRLALSSSLNDDPKYDRVMDFALVSARFGGTIFPEEYRCDYCDIEKSLASGTLSSEASVGESLLLRGICRLASGDHPEADHAFAQIYDLATAGGLEGRWAYRAISYNLLSCIYEAFPPLLRGFPAEQDLSDIITGLKGSLGRYSAHHLGLSKQYESQALPIDIAELDTFLVIWVISSECVKSRSEHDQQSTRKGAVNSVLIDLGHRVVDILDLKDRLLHHDLPCVAAYLGRLCLHYDVWRRSASIAIDMTGLLLQYEVLGDQLGEASCTMHIADSLVSASVTGPLWWNLPLDTQLHRPPLTSTNDHNSDTIIESVRDLVDLATGSHPTFGSECFLKLDLHVPCDLVQAQSLRGLCPPQETLTEALLLYERAEAIFSKYNCKRGQAAILLRRIGLCMMRHFDKQCVWSSKSVYHADIRRLMILSEPLLSAADDYPQLLLLEVYKFLWQGKSAYDECWEIAERAIRNSCSILLRQLAILALQFGHWHRYQSGHFHSAIRGYQIARLLSIRDGSLQSICLLAANALVETHAMFGSVHLAQLYLRPASKALAALEDVFDLKGPVHPTQKPLRDSVNKQLASILINTLDIMLSTMSHTNHRFPHIVVLACDLLMKIRTKCQSAEDHDRLTERRDLLYFLGIRDDWNGILHAGKASDIEMFIRSNYPDVMEADYSQVRWSNHRLICERIKTLNVLCQPHLAERLGMAYLKFHWDWLTDLNLTSSREFEDGKEVNFFDFDSLATSPLDMFELLDQAERCLEVCVSINAWGIAALYVQVLEAVDPLYFISVRSASNFWPWKRRLMFGLTSEHMDSLEDAFHAYGESTRLLLNGLPEDLDPGLRRSIFSLRDSGRIFAGLARLEVFFKHEMLDFEYRFPTISNETTLDDQSEPTRLPDGRNIMWQLLRRGESDAHAVMGLEMDRARHLNSMLGFDWDNLDKHQAQMWLHHYKNSRLWLELLCKGNFRTSAESKEFGKLEEQVATFDHYLYEHSRTSLLAMRALQNTARFEQIVACIKPNTAVIYTSLSADGLLLFCLTHEGIVYSGHDRDLTNDRVSLIVMSYLGLMNTYKHKASTEDLIRKASILSDALIRPLEEHLHARKSIIFVPSGDLARFPLGALLMNGRYLGTMKVVSQIPSLTLLQYHISKDFPSRAFKICAIAKPGTKREEVMPGGEPRLPMAGVEALVLNLYNAQKPLDASKMTRQDLKDCISSSDILHICTHGYIDDHQPEGSYLSLSERFRIIDMTDVRTNASLVICSTCFSGSGRAMANDDVVGFAHAMLGSGAKAFIGALWKANDVVTLLHFFLFHTILKSSSQETTALMDVWHTATHLICTMTIEHARNYLRSIVRIWDKLDAEQWAPNSFVPGGRQRMLDAIDELTLEDGEPSVDFSHPYCWAAFSVVGYADWNFVPMPHDSTISDDSRTAGDAQTPVRTRREHRITA